MTDNHVVDAGVDTDVLDPENGCINYEKCGNVIPYNGKMCGECLDRVRRQDRERDDIS